MSKTTLDQLEKYKRDHNISDLELAKRLGVYYNYISRWRKAGRIIGVYKKIVEDFLQKKESTDFSDENLNKDFVRISKNLKAILKKAFLESTFFPRIASDVEKIENIKIMEKKYFIKIKKFFLELSEISAQFNEKEYEIHKQILRKEIYDLISPDGAVLNNQICEKPLGYAGDYLVANYFYEDGYPGSTIYGMFIDRFTLESDLARAHINRRRYIRKIIERTIFKNRLKSNINVTSFACGPAPEVFDILDSGIKNVNFYLIDGEKQAIEFLERKLLCYEQSRERVNLIHANFLNLIRKKEVANIPKQELIYCAGFFDYIKDTTAVRCLKYMLENLNSGGVLVVVNVSSDDVNNVYLRMIGEWNLHHRTEKELLSLAMTLENVRYAKVLLDYFTKRNMYLIIKKR